MKRTPASIPGRVALILGCLCQVATARAGLNEWTAASIPRAVQVLAVDPVDPSIAYVGTDFGVYKSTDAGETWIQVGLSESITGLAIDPSDPSILFAGKGNLVFKTTDAGDNWIQVYEKRPKTSEPTAKLSSLAASGSFVVARFAFTYCFVPYFCGPLHATVASVDGGATWRDAIPDIHALAQDPASLDTLYGGTDASGGLFPPVPVTPPYLFRSTDGGRVWIRRAKLPTNVTSLAVAPGEPSRVYAGTFQNGVLMSQDEGVTWIESNFGLFDLAVRAIALDRANPSTLYVGTDSGVFKSIDGGAKWSFFGLGGLEVSAVGVDPVSGRTLYAVSSGRLYQITTGPATCTASPTTLCLNGGRFEVSVIWQIPDRGRDGVGEAVPLTADSGYFWFRTPSDVELAVKVLDGRGFNDHFWVLAGSLSDVQYTLTVTDTQTGELRAYFNPSQRLSSFADTAAFPVGGASAQAVEIVASDASPTVSSAYLGSNEACASAPEALCLDSERFRVTVSWSTKDGRSGVGHAIALTPDTGYFWFFNDTNVELIVKVLDGQGVNGHFWVFYGALSDVAYTITVTDSQSGVIRTYANSQGTLASIGDTEAF